MRNFIAHIGNLCQATPLCDIHVLFRQPRLEQVPQRMVVIANEKVESNNAALGLNDDHVLWKGLGRRIEVGILADHGLAHFARTLDDIRHIEHSDGLDRHVITVGLSSLVSEVDARNLHGVEFCPQRLEFCGVLLFEDSYIHLFRIHQPLGKERIHLFGILVACVYIGALRRGLKARIFTPRSYRGLCDQVYLAGSWRQGRNQGGGPRLGMRGEELGSRNYLGIPPLAHVSCNDKVGAGDVSNTVTICGGL